MTDPTIATTMASSGVPQRCAVGAIQPTSCTESDALHQVPSILFWRLCQPCRLCAQACDRVDVVPVFSMSGGAGGSRIRLERGRRTRHAGPRSRSSWVGTSSDDVETPRLTGESSDAHRSATTSRAGRPRAAARAGERSTASVVHAGDTPRGSPSLVTFLLSPFIFSRLSASIQVDTSERHHVERTKLLYKFGNIQPSTGPRRDAGAPGLIGTRFGLSVDRRPPCQRGQLLDNAGSW